jgi:hypothetical protein
MIMMMMMMMVMQAASSGHVYHVTSYGADPTGRSDSTGALLRAISDAVQGASSGSLMGGIQNLGGARIDLDGGNYMISQPLRLPATGVGNLMVCLQATNMFELLLFALTIITLSLNICFM